LKKKIMVLVLSLAAVAFVTASFWPRAKAENWQPVTTISGSGEQISDEFHIKGSEWRIRWSYTLNAQVPSMTAFSFFVYPHGETAVYVGSVVFPDETSGVLSIHEGPKLYYVNVVAGNTPGYTLTIEYDADSEVSDSTLAAIIGLAIGIPIVLMVAIALLARKRAKKWKSANTNMFPPPPPPPPTT
jgi:hypothetical protein